MAVNALQAAKYLCEASGWKLSNLALQKILYIAHMLHLGETGEPLINGRFEAWDYGPVDPSVYRHVKMFGADPIQNVFHRVADITEGSELKALDDVLSAFGDAAPGKLVAITHWADGAWAKYYQPGVRGVGIPNEAILCEFKDRMNAGNKGA